MASSIEGVEAASIPSPLARPPIAASAKPRPPPSYLSPPQAVISSLATSNSTAELSMPPQAASSYSGRYLRERALGKANKIASYLAPRIEQGAVSLSRGISEIREEIRERRDWETAPGVLTTPKGGLQASVAGARPRPKQVSIESYQASSSGDASVPAAEKTNASANTNGGGRWFGGITSYFSAGARERRDSNFYHEERIVCFPGWATLRPSAHSASEPALVLECLTHGYAYRLRPIAQASRSQRVFYALAKSFAALPKIPPHLAVGAAGQSLESLTSTLNDSDLADLAAEGKGNVFEQLLEIGGREGEREDAEEPKSSVQAPMPLSETPTEIEEPSSSSSGQAVSFFDASSIVDAPSSVVRKPRIETRTPTLLPSAARPLPTLPPSSRPASIASIDSASPRIPTGQLSSTPPPPAKRTPRRSETASTAASRKSQASSTSSSIGGWPKPFSYVDEDLPRLHTNLQARLMPFFGQKLAFRKVRLTIFPELAEGSIWDTPLATKVTTTTSGGAFKTHLDIRSKALRRLLDESGQGVESLDGLKLRVVAELLEMDPVGDVLGAGHFTEHRGLKVTAEDETVLVVGKDGGVRVISDIDDTIKWTQVLGGTKTIFRNVFVRELDEIAVPGMTEWYNAMEKLGASFHYVSNSPWELWTTIRDYMAFWNFPPGSVTLKEYGGASSAISKLWEEPGMRKRAGVEAILKEYPHCSFILVGDSGEQDMNLYVSLAREYPTQVLAIYIRDVTTPFHPDLHPDFSTHPTSSMASNSNVKAFSEIPEMPGQFDGSHSHPIFENSSRDPSSTPPSPLNTPSFIAEPHSDPLSPNNPIRPQPEPAPTTTEGERAAVVEQFYQRIGAVEKLLPDGIPLRIFRHGRECQSEALRLVSEHQGGWVR